MYFSVRFTSPAVDPQQAQQQKIMAFVSPAMVGFLGVKYAWPSALIIYWLSFNVFTMAQQFYLIRKYHSNPSAIGPHPEALAAGATAPVKVAKNGAAASLPGAVTTPGEAASGGGGGSRAARRRRSSRR
jgi:YidC/Oxa1 family membrane protein insertase